MPRIVNNRICYATHNVVLDPEIYKNDKADEMNYLLEMAEALTPDGNAKLHKMQLDSFNNDGTWTIELPKIVIKPFHTSEKAEIRQEIPTRMLAIATLFNGNYEKTFCTVHCARSESFLPIYRTMSQHGFNVGRAARREAETAYFKMYNAIAAKS